MAKSATKLQNVSVLVARNRLGAILERAKKNDERFVVSKKGEATAVILGYEDFLRSVLGLRNPRFCELLENVLDGRVLRRLTTRRSTRRLGRRGRKNEQSVRRNLSCLRSSTTLMSWSLDCSQAKAFQRWATGLSSNGQSTPFSEIHQTSSHHQSTPVSRHLLAVYSRRRILRG